MSSIQSNGRVPERFTGDQGASLVEYAFLLALIALVCIGAVTYFGSAVGASFSQSGSSIIHAGSGGP
jgi:Flp pilus assembly pilin Flp